jgi:hypothetical protein
VTHRDDQRERDEFVPYADPYQEEDSMDFRDDDERGTGWCPYCGRAMGLDVEAFGYCEEHGRVPADFTRPAPRLRVGGTVELEGGRRITVLALAGNDVWVDGVDHVLPVGALTPVHEED